MTTIVLNTATGAVSEYDWTFHSITPTHAGDALGLYALGGDNDAGRPIESRITTGKQLWGDSHKKMIGSVHLSMQAQGGGGATVFHGAAASWRYVFQLPDGAGVVRSPFGRGIRENYLGVSFENIQGAAFHLDQIEVLELPSRNRRI